MESMSYVISFRMVFFYLVTVGWIFYISFIELQITVQLKQQSEVHLVPSPSETWFRGMSVGGSFRRE